MSVGVVLKSGQKMIKLDKEVKMNFIEEFTKLEHQLVFLFHHTNNVEVRKSIKILIENIINNIDDNFINNNKTIINNLWLVLETYYRDRRDSCNPLIDDGSFDIFEIKLQNSYIGFDDYKFFGSERNPLGRLALWKHKEIIKEE